MAGRSAPLPSVDGVVHRMEAAVARRIGPARFQLWFQDHTEFRPSAEELVVAVESHSLQEWLDVTFADPVRESAAEVFGAAMPVRFIVDAKRFSNEMNGMESPTQPVNASKKELVPVEPKKRQTLFGEEYLSPVLPPRRKPVKVESGRRWKTLSDFVVGSANRVAHASAVNLVEDPDQSPTPLVFHGPTGTGKTHLLEGIYHGLRTQGPGAGRPVCVTSEEFTTRFVQSTRFGKQANFRRQFRDCSALLIDDLQVLATRRATQEEFLYTLDSLVAEGRPVVVALDCHPRLADDLLPELTDRLLGGTVWGLLPPDDETRLGILRTRAATPGPSFPEDVLTFLARNLRGNVRELEGAVNSIRHFARVTNLPVTLPLAREALGDLLRHVVRAVTLAEIDTAVCGVLGLAAGSLQSKLRTWAVSHPRMLAVFLARKHTTATYGEIAKHFGAKNHSTAVAAEKKVRGWLASSGELPLGDRVWPIRDLIDRIERQLLR